MELTKEDKELIDNAGEISKESWRLQPKGAVGSSLISSKGNIYSGVSIEALCGIGTCGEHSAISSMLIHGENKIKTIVAVYYSFKKDKKFKVIPPCGRCRELMYQMTQDGLNCEVIISKNKKVKLKDLYPHTWKEAFK